MNWYKKYASPALYSPDRGRNISDNSKLKLFNYIKAQNITQTFYHGTLLSRYNMAKKTGYLLGADLNKQPANHITPNEDRKFVFFSPKKIEASYFSSPPSIIDRQLAALDKEFSIEMYDSFSGQPLEQEEAVLQDQLNYVVNNKNKFNESGVLLTINVPLYAITEVRDAILGGMQERTVGSKIKLPDQLLTNEQLLDFIIKKVNSSSILTSYLGVPLKWVTNVEIISENTVDNLIATLDHRLSQFTTSSLSYPTLKQHSVYVK